MRERLHAEHVRRRPVEDRERPRGRAEVLAEALLRARRPRVAAVRRGVALVGGGDRRRSPRDGRRRGCRWRSRGVRSWASSGQNYLIGVRCSEHWVITRCHVALPGRGSWRCGFWLPRSSCASVVRPRMLTNDGASRPRQPAWRDGLAGRRRRHPARSRRTRRPPRAPTAMSSSRPIRPWCATRCCARSREVRDRRDMRDLRPNAQLDLAASRHATDMFERRYFSHVSPGGGDLADRARRAGFAKRNCSWMVGEVLAWGVATRSTAAGTVQAWMDSPSHRRILDLAPLRADRARAAGRHAVRRVPDRSHRRGRARPPPLLSSHSSATRCARRARATTCARSARRARAARRPRASGRAARAAPGR